MQSSSQSPSQVHSQSSVPTDESFETRIKKLPPLLINQLAAGEVVSRPASVVKELVENALDANATHIDIKITQGGMGAIEVTDDGEGIHPDDMVMAVTRYATSKMADVANLQGIRTLGFRGEALAATAAVSRLTLTSSHDDSGIGRKLMVAGILAQSPTLTPVVHNRGTKVRVQDLFFNVPARRQHLKSIATEFAHIETVVKQLAMMAGHVGFSLWHNDKRRFYCEPVPSSALTDTLAHPLNDTFQNTDKTSSGAFNQHRLLRRLSLLLPSQTFHHPTIPSTAPSTAGMASGDDNTHRPVPTATLDVFVDLSGLCTPQVSQLASPPPCIWGILLPKPASTSAHRMMEKSSKPLHLIYINGRLVQDRRIGQAIKQCKPAPMVGLDYVLFFDLPPAWLNVNVHPSKQTIKITNLANVLAHLQLTVQNQLEQWQKNQKHEWVRRVADDTKLPSSASDDVCCNNPSSGSAPTGYGEVKQTLANRAPVKQVASVQAPYVTTPNYVNTDNHVTNNDDVTNNDCRATEHGYEPEPDNVARIEAEVTSQPPLQIEQSHHSRVLCQFYPATSEHLPNAPAQPLDKSTSHTQRQVVKQATKQTPDQVANQVANQTLCLVQVGQQLLVLPTAQYRALCEQWQHESVTLGRQSKPTRESESNLASKLESELIRHAISRVGLQAVANWCLTQKSETMLVDEKLVDEKLVDEKLADEEFVNDD